MYCKNCGSYNNGAKYCNRCGVQMIRANTPGYRPHSGIPVRRYVYQAPVEVYRSVPSSRGCMNTAGISSLTLWCVIALFVCPLVAIYGFIQRSNAIHAFNSYEADCIADNARYNIKLALGIIGGLFLAMCFIAALA